MTPLLYCANCGAKKPVLQVVKGIVIANAANVRIYFTKRIVAGACKRCGQHFTWQAPSEIVDRDANYTVI